MASVTYPDIGENWHAITQGINSLRVALDGVQIWSKAVEISQALSGRKLSLDLSDGNTHIVKGRGADQFVIFIRDLMPEPLAGQFYKSLCHIGLLCRCKMSRYCQKEWQGMNAFLNERMPIDQI